MFAMPTHEQVISVRIIDCLQQRKDNPNNNFHFIPIAIMLHPRKNHKLRNSVDHFCHVSVGVLQSIEIRIIGFVEMKQNDFFGIITAI